MQIRSGASMSFLAQLDKLAEADARARAEKEAAALGAVIRGHLGASADGWELATANYLQDYKDRLTEAYAKQIGAQAAFRVMLLEHPVAASFTDSAETIGPASSFGGKTGTDWQGSDGA